MTPTLRRSPWSCLRTTQMLQVIAMRMLQEETEPIQVPQEEMMQKMVMMTQLHPCDTRFLKDKTKCITICMPGSSSIHIVTSSENNQHQYHEKRFKRL
jgi:hypothetical protein